MDWHRTGDKPSPKWWIYQTPRVNKRFPEYVYIARHIHLYGKLCNWTKFGFVQYACSMLLSFLGFGWGPSQPNPLIQLIFSWETWLWCEVCKFHTQLGDWYLEYSSKNTLAFVDNKASTSSVDGLVPSDMLLKPVLAKISDDRRRH